MNQTERETNSSQASRRVLGTLGAVAAFAIAGGIWMHADEQTAQSLAGGVATASISAAPEVNIDPSLPRAGEAPLPEREEAAEASPTF